jgi:hypothetical protein
MTPPYPQSPWLHDLGPARRVVLYMAHIYTWGLVLLSSLLWCSWFTGPDSSQRGCDD